MQTKSLEIMKQLRTKEFHDVLPSFYKHQKFYIEPELFTSMLHSDDYKYHRRVIYVEEYTESDKNMRKLLDSKVKF